MSLDDGSRYDISRTACKKKTEAGESFPGVRTVINGRSVPASVRWLRSKFYQARQMMGYCLASTNFLSGFDDRDELTEIQFSANSGTSSHCHTFGHLIRG